MVVNISSSIYLSLGRKILRDPFRHRWTSIGFPSGTKGTPGRGRSRDTRQLLPEEGRRDEVPLRDYRREDRYDERRDLSRVTRPDPC